MHKILTTALLACLLAPAAAFAQASPATLPDWAGLTPEQREQLIAPLRERWDNASPERRRHMLEHADRWQSMTPEERQRARQGANRWNDMPPERRQQARALYEHLRTLPEAERKALTERWKTMTPEQRRAWVEAHPPSEEARPRRDRRGH